MQTLKYFSLQIVHNGKSDLEPWHKIVQEPVQK